MRSCCQSSAVASYRFSTASRRDALSTQHRIFIAERHSYHSTKTALAVLRMTSIRTCRRFFEQTSSIFRSRSDVGFVEVCLLTLSFDCAAKRCYQRGLASFVIAFQKPRECCDRDYSQNKSSPSNLIHRRDWVTGLPPETVALSSKHSIDPDFGALIGNLWAGRRTSH